jgi:hypothetical protein
MRECLAGLALPWFEDVILGEGIMKFIVKCLTLMAAAGSITLSQPASAETPVGSNVESRLVLALKADDAAVTALMPQGWRGLTLPQGPFAGANLLVLLSDRHLGLDPDGNPIDPYASRYAALVAYGVSPEAKGPRMFVLRTYETPPVVAVYGNAVAAEISRVSALSGSGDSPRERTETWEVAAANGDRISLELDYRQGRPGWSSGEAMPYSAETPDFHRIYRYDQLADLAMSTGLGRPLDGEIAFEASVPSLLDGTQDIQAITMIPVYIRKVSLP